MTLLKKGVLDLDGGARISFHAHSCGEFPKCGLFSAPKWSISPIDSIISESFQRSQSWKRDPLATPASISPS